MFASCENLESIEGQCKYNTCTVLGKKCVEHDCTCHHEYDNNVTSFILSVWKVEFQKLIKYTRGIQYRKNSKKSR